MYCHLHLNLEWSGKNLVHCIFVTSFLKHHSHCPNVCGLLTQVHRAVMIISLFTTLIGFIMAFVANAKKSVPGLIEFDSSVRTTCSITFRNWPSRGINPLFESACFCFLQGVNTTHFVFGIAIMLLHIINVSSAFEGLAWCTGEVQYWWWTIIIVFKADQIKVGFLDYHQLSQLMFELQPIIALFRCKPGAKWLASKWSLISHHTHKQQFLHIATPLPGDGFLTSLTLELLDLEHSYLPVRCDTTSQLT